MERRTPGSSMVARLLIGSPRIAELGKKPGLFTASRLCPVLEPKPARERIPNDVDICQFLVHFGYMNCATPSSSFFASWKESSTPYRSR